MCLCVCVCFTLLFSPLIKSRRRARSTTPVRGPLHLNPDREKLLISLSESEADIAQITKQLSIVKDILTKLKIVCIIDTYHLFISHIDQITFSQKRKTRNLNVFDKDKVSRFVLRKKKSFLEEKKFFLSNIVL